MKMNLQYLDIPLGLKLKTEELGYGTFFLQLGFNPMFNINAHVTSEDGIFDKEDIKASVSTFCLGYHVGAGFEYRLGGSTSAIGGVRWTSGLTNVTENDGANISTECHLHSPWNPILIAMKIAIAQLNYLIGDFEGNLVKYYQCRKSCKRRGGRPGPLLRTLHLRLSSPGSAGKKGIHLQKPPLGTACWLKPLTRKREC